MPEGFADTEEAQLHKAPRLLNPGIGQQLQGWWLAVPTGMSRTPNWDIASTCTVTWDGRTKPGLLLVEAKAHTEELNQAGKNLRNPVTANSRRNHIQIGVCIHNANLALKKETGFPWALSHDWNYQMSNRFTWSWKLTELGFPVILVYLGFLNATEMDKVGKQKHFDSHAEWEALVKSHSKSLFPETVWDNNKSLTLHGQSFIPLIRSLDIRYNMPITGSGP